MSRRKCVVFCTKIFAVKNKNLLTHQLYSKKFRKVVII